MATGLSGTPAPGNSPESLSRPRSAYVANLAVGAVPVGRGWHCCNYYKVVEYESSSFASDG